MNIFKKLYNRNKAKQEHQNRSSDPLYDLDFTTTLNDLKDHNKKILLQNLMEAAGVAPDDLIGICYLDKLIEDNKEIGVITELYTRPEGQ